MQTTNTNVPQFRTHSMLRATLRGTALVTLASAIVISFLAEVWHGPAQPDLRASAAVAASADA
jgi:hypothetical protein